MIDALALEAIRDNAQRQRDAGQPIVKTPWYVLVTLCDIALSSSSLVDHDSTDSVKTSV